MTEKITIIDFYAEWCGPCKSLMPIIEKIVQEDGNIELIKNNIEEDIELAQKYKVRSVPTLVLFSDKKSETLIGLNSEQKIRDSIKSIRNA